MKAIDCKESADYAQHAFGQGNETDARRYVEHLEQRLTSLKGAMASLDYANRKIKENGADASA